jgi:hypothetical protein
VQFVLISLSISTNIFLGFSSHFVVLCFEGFLISKCLQTLMSWGHGTLKVNNKKIKNKICDMFHCLRSNMWFGKQTLALLARAILHLQCLLFQLLKILHLLHPCIVSSSNSTPSMSTIPPSKDLTSTIENKKKKVSQISLSSITSSKTFGLLNTLGMKVLWLRMGSFLH